MNEIVKRNCDLLVRNRQLLKKGFFWSNEYMEIAGSSFYAGLGIEADIERMKECERILKDETGFFSSFRSHIRMPILCRMAINPDPEAYLFKLKDLVKIMEAFRWKNASYRILSAMIIAEHAENDQEEELVKKMVKIYQGMKEDHPWLTGDEDVPFAAMMAISEKSTDEVLDDAESCYQNLSGSFFSRNAVQSLSQVLSIMPGLPSEKSARVLSIFDALKGQDHKFGASHELSVLGALASLDIPDDQIVKKIIEADEYLKDCKGFGSFSMGSRNRRMYAAMMVMNAFMPSDSSLHETLMNSVLTMVIQMEAAMAVTAASAASSSSH